MKLGRIENENTNFDFEEIPYSINLSGVTWENRQLLIKNLSVGSVVNLKRDYHNEFDKNAIAVQLADKTQIGWIPKKYAEVLAQEIDAGIEWKAKIERLLGNDETLRGVLIKLFLSRPDVI
jgi:hypothetical protein